MRERGLTLIELAIVLVVIGVLLGLGASVIGVLIKRNKYVESREIVSANLEGIVGYAIANSRLPSSETELTGSIRSARDSYGKYTMYVYSGNLDDSSGVICSATSTNITLRIGCADTACTSYEQEVPNVAFLVVSGDGNYNIQTWHSSLTSVSSGTVVIGRADTAVTLHVYSYGLSVDDYTGDVNRSEPYDDIVKWVSLYELKPKAGCTGGGGGSGGGGGDGGGSGGCTYSSIQVTNTWSFRLYYSTSTVTCQVWSAGVPILLPAGDTLNIYSSSWRCSSGLVRDAISFASACAMDAAGNSNGVICYDGFNFSDC